MNKNKKIRKKQNLKFKKKIDRFKKYLKDKKLMMSHPSNCIKD